jgi:hypothetical protein
MEFDQFADTPDSFFRMVIQNNIGTPNSDGIRDQQTYGAQFLTMALQDSTASVFGDRSLPNSIDLADFDSTTLRFWHFEGEGESSIDVTDATYNIVSWSDVPEPTSLALLALVGLPFLRRRLG